MAGSSTSGGACLRAAVFDAFAKELMALQKRRAKRQLGLCSVRQAHTGTVTFVHYAESTIMRSRLESRSDAGRYLVAEGRVAGELADCVPTVPQWRLSSLPRYLEFADVERVIASCDVSTRKGLRDRAVILLLARLGDAPYSSIS